MNPLSPNITKGTFGELFVQLRLLQYGVQAAPPIKDSGNDLIAVRDEVFRAIQVKTCTAETIDAIRPNRLPKRYHILAVVLLDPHGEGTEISLDQCRIFPLQKEEMNKRWLDNLEACELSPDRIDALFS